MRFKKYTARFLVLLLVSVFCVQPALAASQLGTPLAQYATELSGYTSLKYFKGENLQRYIDYKTANKALSWETVITYVNIGLDNPYYTHTITISDPAATNALINKYRALPADYVPTNLETISTKYSDSGLRLVHDARVALERLCADAAGYGFSLYALSAYRSYSYQKDIYDSYYDPDNPNDSKLLQEQIAAHPGFSEHQTGLAVDIASADGDLGGSDAFNWYKKYACDYGYIIRYPRGKEAICGYTNEPWHLRYLGVELATAVYKSGLTYDEYFAQELDTPVISGASTAVAVTDDARLSSQVRSAQLSTLDISSNTYYKLRDLAFLLSSSSLQFDLGWDAAASKVSLTPGKPYTGSGSLSGSDPGSAVLVKSVALPVKVGTSAVTLDAYSYNGANYIGLEPLLQILGASAAQDKYGSLQISPK